MKKTIATLAILAAACCAAFAQPGQPGQGGPGMPGFGPGGPGGFGRMQREPEISIPYTLKVGDVTMVIDAGRGGKITSYKLGEKELLNTSPIPNQFGSTFWTSPQKEWNWPPVPEFDSRPYVVSEINGHLLMASRKSAKIPMRIVKDFSVNEKAGCIVVTYSIFNEGDEARKVAPWEITRVPSKGVILFDAPVEQIELTSGPEGSMTFKGQNGLAWYEFDVVNQNRKVNSDGKGWLAYSNNGLLLLKKFQDIDPSQPAPAEAEIQVYVNQGDTYTELESQGAYELLQPGESLSWTVEWYLVPTSCEAAPSAALAAEVKSLVK